MTNFPRNYPNTTVRNLIIPLASSFPSYVTCLFQAGESGGNEMFLLQISYAA